MNILINLLQKQITSILGVVVMFYFVGGCGLKNKKDMLKGGGAETVGSSSYSFYTMQQDFSGGFIKKESTIEKNWKERLKELLEKLPKCKKVVLFLQPGLNEEADTMDFLNETLSEKESVNVYTLQDASDKVSLHQPIENQIKIIINEIKNKNIDFDSAFLGLIGYSQGGVVLQLVADKMKKEGKVIELFVIAINTPLRGVPALQKKCQDIQNLFGSESVKKGLKLSLGTIPDVDIHKAIDNMKGSTLILQGLGYLHNFFPPDYQYHGLYALKPKSICLNRVKLLIEEDVSVLRTFLSSRCDDLWRIFKISNNNDVQEATLAFKRLIANGETHDMLVPTYSQLAEGIGMHNPTICRREITRGNDDYLAHSRNLLAFGGIPAAITDDSTILSHISCPLSLLSGEKILLTSQPVPLPSHINLVLESPRTVDEILYSTYDSVLKMVNKNNEES